MAEVVYKTIFQFKRGTAEAWDRNNPILRAGEPGFELDTGKVKVGDGVTDWRNLKYLGDDTSIRQEIFSAPTVSDFPTPGDESLLYRAYQERTLYQWNSVFGSYESLCGGTGDIPQIDVIVCGTSETII